jgi:Fic family protein
MSQIILHSAHFLTIFEPNKSSNRLMKYNWQQQDWPDFKYNSEELEDMLFAFAEETGYTTGLLKTLPEDIRIETMINIMVSEAIKTSEIEGEYLSRQDVVSSVRNNLGLNEKEDKVKDKKAQGAGQLMVAVRNTFSFPLTENILFSWHKMLLDQNTKITIGNWRMHNEPMQVVSGAIGKEKIHFEAPPSARVPKEMHKFIQWFNDTAPGGKKEIKKAPIRSAIAHLYFESIHPFEDGNGRIGRAIAEKALSQTIGRPVLLSLSQTIEADKKSYYSALEIAQHSTEITPWMKYFLNTILIAQLQAKKLVDFTLKKASFFDHFENQFNDRQLKVIRKMLDAEPKGFEGGMTANKYISITKVSKATATRDLQLLTESKALLLKGGGRSIHYILNIE